jgi:hypothetical protein
MRAVVPPPQITEFTTGSGRWSVYSIAIGVDDFIDRVMRNPIFALKAEAHAKVGHSDTALKIIEEALAHFGRDR